MLKLEQESHFLTRETWFDMQKLVLGFVSGCQFYMGKYSSEKKYVVCRRCNQDICEHHFAHVREAGGSTSAISASDASNSTGTAAVTRLLKPGPQVTSMPSKSTTNCEHIPDSES